jgi:hypothetical protein
MCFLHLQGRKDEDTDNTFFRNVGKHLPYYTASHPRRQYPWLAAYCSILILLMAYGKFILFLRRRELFSFPRSLWTTVDSMDRRNVFETLRGKDRTRRTWEKLLYKSCNIEQVNACARLSTGLNSERRTPGPNLQRSTPFSIPFR